MEDLSSRPAPKGLAVPGGLCGCAGFFLPLIHWWLTLAVLGEAIHSLGHSGHSLSTLAILLGDLSDVDQYVILFLLVALAPHSVAGLRSGKPASTPPVVIGGSLGNLLLGSLLLWILALDGAWLPEGGPHARVLWTLATAMLLGGSVALVPRVRESMWLATLVPACAFVGNGLAPRPTYDFGAMIALRWRLGPMAFLPMAGLALSLFVLIRRRETTVIPAARGALVSSLWALCSSTSMGALMPHHHLCLHLGSHPEREVATYVLIAATQLAFFAQLFWRFRKRWHRPTPSDVQASRDGVT